MQHDLQASGFALRLRPVELKDAAFIVWLRNQDHAKGWIGDSAADIAAQEDWLRRYFDRPLDYYFLVETESGIPVGTYGFYDFDGSTAETGRWVIRSAVPAALPCVVLALGLAFDQLGLSAVRARTVATNLAVLSIHRKLGFKQVGLQSSAQVIGGHSVDMVLSVLYKADGLQARERLQLPARVAERRLRAWEQLHAAEIVPPGFSVPRSTAELSRSAA